MTAPDRPGEGPVDAPDKGAGKSPSQSQSPARPAAADTLAHLLRDYTPIKGVPDELLDGNGAVRPVWKGFLDQIAALPREDLDLACARGSQYLRDAGVFFRHYGPDSQEERDWPLAHLPLLIEQQEWDGIAAGLIERADLLERIMADLYGANQLVADGLLPAELLTSNPEWLRPMVGVTPRDGHYLHMLAFDIGRGPEGQWWVLGDRAQAPSGAGFALETRMATARSFPGQMSKANVARLAGFFRGFRDALLALRSEEQSRVAILTPGPLNDTYFEHAYIARYLGFLLVQGEDLVVRDGKLMVHTVGGLQPISVLWRRLDATWLDPLELNEDSQIGTPGILSSLRAGALTMVNAPGSGVLETRALMAFIPAIARHMLGRDLDLPNIATWWCGAPGARAYVAANAARMTIDRALSTSLPFDHSPDVVIGGRAADGSLFDPAMIERKAGALAAQQIVSLSTAPALDDGRLVARPFSMRVILARTSQGWQVMPGGFARVGHSDASADISVQRGGSVCDVWVVGTQPRPDDTLLAGTTSARPSLPQLAALPTRAADNLFWLGRYSDRVEQKIRLQRAYHLRLAESGRDDLPLQTYLATYLGGQGVEAAQPLPQGLLDDLEAAMGSAGRVRDRFSTDGWNALTDLRRTAQRLAPRLKPGDDAARALSVLLRKISGFSGLVHENMYHATGWRFLSLGRAIERAWATTNMLLAFAQPGSPHGTYEIAIEAGDAVMTHRMLFSAAFTRETVLDLLLLNEAYPRAVLAQLDAIMGHLDWLEKLTHDLSGKPTPIRAEVMKLRTDLATASAADITPDRLVEIANATARLSGLLAETYLR